MYKKVVSQGKAPHCTLAKLIAVISPNMGNLTKSFMIVGDCVHALPC